MDYLKGDYRYSLNSTDQFDLDLPLTQSKANGGTMILWRTDLDPYVTRLEKPSSSILPILFEPPWCNSSIHVCIYFPTSGHEDQFLIQASLLSCLIHDLQSQYEGMPIYLRGDFNASSSNPKRNSILRFLKETHKLNEVNLGHKTYHHFVGNGTSDSDLDKLLYSSQPAEKLINVLCKLSNPLVNSLHDVIISTLSFQQQTKMNIDDIEAAPVVPNNRQKTIWSEEGIIAYQNLISPHLLRLQSTWLTQNSSPTSKTCIGMLMQFTNNLMITCATRTNKTMSLSENHMKKSRATPLPVRQSARKLLKLSHHLKYLKLSLPSDSPPVCQAQLILSQARTAHRKLVRHLQSVRFHY